MRWVAMVLTLLLLVLAGPAESAFAQSIPSPPAGKTTPADEASAKKNFENGLRLYGEGAYAEALIAFEQSYRVGGRPSALKNIAQCHRNLKHFVEAYEAYEQMLGKHEAQISAADKKAIQQALDELGVLSATVMVDVSEPDAEIEIDGKSAGRSPMTKPKRVAATGGHSVRVTKPTFARFEQTFTVDSQQNKKIDVKLELEKTTGHVSVREQSGREVHVFIDGQDKGAAPWEGEVAAGEHTIEAKGARFASEGRKITIAAKERLDLALDAAALRGRLRITTVPATANIAVDGNTVGAGAWDGELAEGPHHIEVSLPGQTPQTRDIMLGRGQFVAQEIAIVAAIASSQQPVYPGLYVGLSLSFGVAVGGPPDDSVEPVRSEGGAAILAGTALRVGRMWDWYGAEVVGLVAFEHRSRDYRYDAPAMTGTGAGTTSSPTFRDGSDSIDAFIGIGPRVISKDETVRFTFGIAPGIGIHTFNPNRGPSGDLQPLPDNSGSSNRFVTQPSGGTGGQQNDEQFKAAGYTAFGFLMDGGILIGSTPGTKFYIGAQAWLDFAPTLVTGPDTRTPIPSTAFKRPGRGITVTDGTQFYVGPTLGLQFGH